MLSSRASMASAELLLSKWKLSTVELFDDDASLCNAPGDRCSKPFQRSDQHATHETHAASESIGP